jgi:hypothetical protein
MALTALTGLVRHGKFLLNENSRTILTGVGVAGTISTAYLTGRASFKAARLIDQEKQELENENGHGDVEVTLPRKIQLVWRHYIPPGAVCLTTVTCIIVANKIASKKIAALALASGISERALQEYKEKVIEKLGERQDTKIRDEIAQQRVNNHPLGSKEIILAGTGEVLCFDLATGRYFQSTVEEIKRAENKINHRLNNFMYASASEFYDEIGLAPTTYSDNVGWNANKHVEVQFSSVLSPDGRPCLAIDFVTPPFTEYSDLHD